MSNHVDRIVVFPRYTALIGTTALYSAPMDVRQYASAVMMGWQSGGLGTGTPAAVTFTVQQSADLDFWTDGTPFSPTADTELKSNEDFKLPWLRVKAEVAGSDPGVTCWLLGEFLLRDGLVAREAA